MTFYTGKSADGSDATVVDGVYVSPDGNYWGTKPFTKQQRELENYFRIHKEIEEYCSQNNRTLEKEYKEILNKTSKLPQSKRNHIINLAKEWNQ